MQAADDTRKLWASLLQGEGFLPQGALSAWLSLAGQAAGGEGSGMPQPGALPQMPDWATAMGPLLGTWSTALDSMQGAPWSMSSSTAGNPLARLLSHPASVVGGDQSSSRLSATAATALMDFMQASMNHQALQAQGWMTAMQRFASDFTAKGTGDDGPPVVLETFDQLLDHWGVIGEAALQEHMRGEAFLNSQAEILRTSMRYRIARRTAMEATARANDLPTLSDLDEAFSAIHDLRRELREVRQIAQKALTSQTAPAAVKPSSAKRAPAVKAPAQDTRPRKPARRARRMA